MSNNVNATSTGVDSLYWDRQKQAEEQKPRDELSQEDFFSLLTQQLSFQDPSKPADNDQMIAQMTSFTMAEGISKLNENFDSLAASMTSNSALQASTLIGKKALLESTTLEHGGDSLSKGSVIVQEPVQNLSVGIYDEAGALVNTLELGEQSAGAVRFTWDGKNKDGETMPPGEYTIKAEGMIEGEYQTLPSATFRNIDSVNVNGANGIVINTKEGAVRLTDIAEIA
ncbi:flagellar hook assembly protein FlgD [Pseudoalteromonas sp. McH1-7]|uniref:Basal-body rod modification protein FlgD n=1 Tax=Pseudoalteromonas peptidolytica F12-50-A1 TaxID=1315280 RepID=A0A8I0T569_9GAMM|nr:MULTISPECIES: flagellar hook assembly protein FlgD [Pseudoalteromonas]MBE0346908.1 flagellar basal-body rod modification protein FlgD [Pseudoalteromonas peptidolytica F12-50-A1]MDW7550075.1 flagellar hook assembly protein FlgD [Pseudoalteromonas peptidolytica]NLR13970.1 flagellar hook assembly protein FlgD [Pseudoalteromonas peptidolytica]NUZ09620.1 flagellar hook assembly protein FlgD [Pseudoalteromonas sp. McH1-7]USD29590.1 flagellar hook assembly protein FlgD [Pseudoalteromonas sp. SCSIO